MSEKNTKKNTDHAARGPFATVEEARKVTPKSAAWSLFSVARPNGSVVYTWAGGHGTAVDHVAQADGYRATGVKAVDRGTLLANLAQLSAEDRAALLAQLGAGAPAAPAAAPAKPAPKRS